MRNKRDKETCPIVDTTQSRAKATAADLGFSATGLAEIASWYQARVDAGDLPGAVVAIARNGKLAYLKAIGFQDHGKTIPMKPDAIFWIASMTKPVTSVAAMILMEEGKLDLEAPVSRYLPKPHGMQVATEETDPATGKMKFALAPQKRPMAFRSTPAVANLRPAAYG